MLYTISQYFLLFYILSIVGYICELVGILITKKRISLHRGYLLGPYLPIFGFGGLIVTIFLKEYQQQPLTLLVLGMVYCGVLEYFTSYALEKIFNLRWWDYSDKKLNINGRVCLETMLMFGVGSIVLVNTTSKLQSLSSFFSNHVIISLAIVLFIIMLFDTIISTREILRLKKDLVLVDTKDATKELKTKMKKSLQDNYYYYIRIIKAFPHLKVSDERINKMSKLLKEKPRRGENNEE